MYSVFRMGFYLTPYMSCITLEYIYCYTTQRPVTEARQNVAVTLQ